MKQLLPILLILLNSFTYSQDLILKSGNSTKTINANTFIEVGLPDAAIGPCAECPGSMISGKLISSKDQKITLQVALKHESLSVDDKVVGFSSEKYTTPALGPTVTIPSSSILYIEKSGKRKLRSQSTGNTIGAIFTVLGLAHLASSPIAYINDGDSGNLLLALGAAELTTGLIVGFTFDNRPLITNQDCPKWSEGKKLWEIQ